MDNPDRMTKDRKLLWETLDILTLCQNLRTRPFPKPIQILTDKLTKYLNERKES